MADVHDCVFTGDDDELDGFSASASYGTYAAGEICTDLAQIYADVLHFEQSLRRAVHILTVAEFCQLRQQYEDVWTQVLGEL